jgi:pimeloyl-ACP methyl ester carboxylesterase
VLCPDTIGRGLSSWAVDPRTHYCFASYARLASNLVDAFGLERIRWLGTSMGGTLGIILAAGELRDRISHLVLNHIAPELTDAAARRVLSYARNPPRFAAVAELEGFFRQVYEPFGQLTDDEWQGLTRHSLRRCDDGRVTVHYDPRLTDQLINYPDDYVRWPEYEAVGAKTLLLRGERSDMVVPEWADEMTRRGPRCRLEIIPGCGHAPYLNTPAQIEIVARFLAS